MSNIPQLLQQGLQAHQAGNLMAADQYYQQILAQEKQHPDALHLHGMVLLANGDLLGAEKFIKKAIKVHPVYAEYFEHLGLVYAQQGKLDKLKKAFQSAQRFSKQPADCWNNLGSLLLQNNAQSEALSAFKKALEIAPNRVDILNNLAVNYLQLRQLKRARRVIDEALSLEPAYPPALNTRGNIAQEQAEYQAAIVDFCRALELDPNYIDAMRNISNAYREIGSYAEANKWLDRLLTVAPSSAVFRQQGLLRETQGHYAQAIEAYDKTLEMQPADAETKQCKAQLLLALGQWAEGWRLFESRFEAEQKNKIHPWRLQTEISKPGIPLWRGETLDAKQKLLLWAEQGIGDEIFFAALLPEVCKRAQNIELEVEARLVELVQRSFPNIKVKPRGNTPSKEHASFMCSLGSLPTLFDSVTEAGLPQSQYLFADQQRAAIAPVPPGSKRMRVGLAWRSRGTALAYRKSMQLQDFLPLLQCSEIEVHALQYDATPEELSAFNAREGTSVQFRNPYNYLADQDALAADIDALDLVITTSNATAHLAGALGKPTWLLLSGLADWRWQATGDRSHWYQSVEMFRQPQDFSWHVLVEQLVDRIKAKVRVHG